MCECVFDIDCVWLFFFVIMLFMWIMLCMNVCMYSINIIVWLESPKILIHICIRPKAKTEDKDMSEDEHVVL